MAARRSRARSRPSARKQPGALTRSKKPVLDVLTREFDTLLLRMQTPKARAGTKRAFQASPKQLGKAAVAAARQRG